MSPRSATSTRERLSRGAIASGALALADREGLDAVTIRRLAADNAVTPMALYWHFKDKEAVFDGIAEQIYSSIVLPEATDAAWHEQLRDILYAVLAAVRPHPLVADLLMLRVMRSEAGQALAERVIGLLRKAGFSAPSATQTASFLMCSIVILVTSEPGSKVIAGQDVAANTRLKRAELDALDPERFPNLVESSEFFLVCEDEDTYFANGVEFLVKGTVGVLAA